ncbi:MAG: hypothetical protein ACTIJN_09520 [Microbacterium gubbeenense]|uniref:hypothetical protein n=1 Tax=Microbacterium gubbeenense TaxID=159896 RepID=UPI0004068038|nr:hypothetical protein [Microbacterium gubbeenense]
MRTSVKIWLSLIPGILFVAVLVYFVAQTGGSGSGSAEDNALALISFTASAHVPWILLA